MSKDNRVSSSGLKGVMLNLIGNIIEVKGRGILFLGTGKSPSSVFLAILYDDVFVIADDNCNVMRVDNIWNPQLKRIIRIQEHDFVDFPLKYKSEIIGTAWQWAPGQMRNQLITHLFHNKEIRLELERLFQIPSKIEQATTFEEYKAQQLRDVQLHSFYIDAMAQRMAHKNWTQIEYIFFLMPGILSPKLIKNYFEESRIALEERFGDRVQEYYNYIVEVLFDNQEGILYPKKNTIYVEADPEKQVWLGTLARAIDFRGDEWRGLFKKTEIVFCFAFYYDSMLDKVRAIYDLIQPRFRIYDHREFQFKYLKEEWEDREY